MKLVLEVYIAAPRGCIAQERAGEAPPQLSAGRRRYARLDPELTSSISPTPAFVWSERGSKLEALAFK